MVTGGNENVLKSSSRQIHSNNICSVDKNCSFSENEYFLTEKICMKTKTTLMLFVNIASRKIYPFHIVPLNLFDFMEKNQMH
jgi:hypothetical protein